MYIEDTKETVLGSAGHVLELKATDPNTRNLKAVLIEENRDCYKHLKNVIKRRWPTIKVEKEEDAFTELSSGIFLLNLDLQNALAAIRDVDLGNCIYFFDPLRSVEWHSIEQVAQKRITTYYQTATEFIIFLFTSDWFLGRDDFTALPQTNKESAWSRRERDSVLEADGLFGDKEWRAEVLNNLDIELRQGIFIKKYRTKLHKWFRYVLPLPFNPKAGQIFHLIICSNYEVGIRRTRDAYTSISGNPKYLPNNRTVYKLFKVNHPELLRGLKGSERPGEWKMLWRVITKHEEGLCDCKCRDFEDIDSVQKRLDWLADNGYLKLITIENAWEPTIQAYQLDWDTITEKLAIAPHPELEPISPENARIRNLFDIEEPNQVK